MPHTSRSRRIAAALAVVTLVLGACGGDDTATTGPTDPAGTVAPVATDAATTTDAPTTTVAASTSTSTTVAPYTSEVYADPAHWMCRADTDDTCDTPYDVTVVAADGTATVRSGAPDPAAPVDCFYVYPTISEDPTLNSDLVAGAELGVLAQQAAQYNELCTVYAPVYRSVTLAGLFGQAGGDRATAWQTAYDDVADAWRHYLANDNDGRGVILIGHSQGAGHLGRLLADVIDPDPAQRKLLVSAHLIGSSVAVPVGADVGGDLQEIPLCRSLDATGCVVTYATFRSTAPPPENALFGRPRSGEGMAGCVNPAAPAGGPAELSARMSSADWVLTDRSLAPTTPFMDMPGLLRAECVERDGFSYLEITVVADPLDPRADDIQGDLSPEWGLHLVDIPVAGGSLLEMAHQQVEAYQNQV